MASTTDARTRGVIHFDAADAVLTPEINNAVRNLRKVIDEHKPLIEEIRVYRKYVPVLINYAYQQQSLIDGFNETLDRYEGKTKANNNKRWTPEEDLVLIDEVAEGKATILELSTMMGRTPASIKTRVSHLVGLKRLSQEGAGRFVGTIDGVDMDGCINGTLYKETK